MLDSLSNATFAKLFAAQVIALLGTGLTTVALALLAFELAGEEAGLVLGTALAIKMVAYVSLAPIAGSLAQRVPRRAFLIGLDLTRAGLVLCLPFVSAIWQIYLLIFLMQAASAAFTPTFQATIPDLFDDEAGYTRALALSRFAFDLESLISPALAGALLVLIHFDALFAANGLAFLVSALLISTSTLPPVSMRNGDEPWLARTTFGLRAYLATPRLRGLLALSMAVAACGAMVIVNTVVYVQAHLGLDETATALLLSAFGAGSMTAAIFLPRVLSGLSDRTVMITGGIVLAAAMGVGVLLPGYALALAVWFALGLGYSSVLMPAGRLLRRSSREEDRPAYFAAQFALSHACFLVTYPLAGVLGSAVGLPAAFAVLGLLAVASTLLAVRVWPVKDALEQDHIHEAIDHNHLHVHDAHHDHPHEGWEGPEPHAHAHRHGPIRHRHAFVIDAHHQRWPGQ